MVLLGYSPADLRVAVAVLKRAQDIRAEHEKNIADYISGRTAGLTASQITKWFKSAFS